MQGHVKVMPASWRHVPGLSRLIRETRRRRATGYAPASVPAGAGAGVAGEALIWAPRWSPSLGLLQSVWGAPVPGVQVPHSFVAEQDGRPVGLAQMTPRPEPQQWDVVYLALEVGERSESPHRPLRLVPDRRATRLLGELCDASVQLGAERLFARVPEEGKQYELFRQVGFTPVVREYTYYRPLDPAAPPPRLAPRDVPGLRPQHRSDAFGLLQLYQACNPKLVQLAEGQRSLSWELPAGSIGRRLTRRPRVQRWVVEREGRKAGWLQLTLQRKGIHTLRLMADEQYGEVVGALVDFAIGQAAAQPAQGIVVSVREHQRRLLGALEDRGFGPIDGHYLMVKQLATPVLQPQFGRVLEKVV